MPAQTVSQAVARKETGPESLIAKYQNDFASVLPTHIEPAHWVRLAQGVLRRDDKLRDAAEKNPGSFLAALLDCARLGHEPGTDQYALTHFRNSKTGVPEIVGIEQYQGEIERMYRAGAVTSVIAEVIRDKDLFAYNPNPHAMAVDLSRWFPWEQAESMAQSGFPAHFKGFFCSDPPGQTRHARFLSEDERGPLVGVYSFARFAGGVISRVVEMGHAEVMKHKAVAKTTKFWDGPWEQSMWLKTAIHELEKWVPTSAEYRKEQMKALAEADRIRVAPQAPQVQQVHVDTHTGEILDAEIVPDQPEPAEWPPVAEPGSRGGDGR